MNIYANISANKWKTWLIMILFVAFISTVAYVISRATGYGPSFGIIAFVLAIITSIGSYFYSDKLVLATSGARLVPEKENPELYHLVENLAMGDGLPKPKIYIINDASPNAFATGRDPKHSAVAVTQGLLDRLNRAELEGVLAHELSHVKNYDTRLMAITAILVGFIAILADLFMRNLWFGGIGGQQRDDEGNGQIQAIFLIVGIVLAILAPVVATLIQLAISRKREFLADASGALLTRYPDALADALEKISTDPRPLKTATNATAHLFIVNPFKGKQATAWLSSLFNTHPPTAERIKILRSM